MRVHVFVCVCLVTQSCSWQPHGLQLARLFCSQGFSRQEHWSGLPCSPPGDFPNPEIESRSPTLQVDSLPSEPQGKPKNTGVGSLSLLQGIFLTQELNQGLLYCPRRRKWQPTPVLLLGEFHRQRSLVGSVHGIAKSRTRLCD